MAIGAGVALGIVAALPLILQLRRAGGRSLGRGIAAIIVSFALIQAVMLVLLVYARTLVAPVGVSASLTFLALVTIIVLREHLRSR